MDSRVAVDALMGIDPGFQQLCKTLLGDSVDPVDVWDYLYGTDPVVKMSDPSEVHVNNAGKRPPMRLRAKSVGKLALTKKGAVLVAGGGAVGLGTGLGVNPPRRGSSNQYGYSLSGADDFVKSDDEDGFDVTWYGEFAKADDDKRQVFGWASVVSLDGLPVVDRQGDWITPDEIEKAAYKYVHESRKGGHQHKRTDDDQPFHASDMIESIVFTPEKIAKMGLPDDFPVGWWVGYQVRDEDTWAKVKKGEVTGFSIHGRGRRRPVEA